MATRTPVGNAGCKHRCAHFPGPLERLREHHFARLEMRIEPAVGQSRAAHDIGDTDASIAVTVNCLGSNVKDPVPREFLLRVSQIDFHIDLLLYDACHIKPCLALVKHP